MGCHEPALYTQLRANTTDPNSDISIDTESVQVLSHLTFDDNDGDDIIIKEPAQTLTDYSADANTESTLPGKFFGPSNLQQQIKILCAEYSDIFRRSVGAKPANLPSLDFGVDTSKWRIPANTGSPRPQTIQKEAELEQQIRHMLELRVIQPSQAPYYSQALLVAKPTNKWRFCIDYRRFNDCCDNLGWPLPNIHNTLQRVGAKRPRWFAKFDMTSGYHQMPLHES